MSYRGGYVVAGDPDGGADGGGGMDSFVKYAGFIFPGWHWAARNKDSMWDKGGKGDKARWVFAIILGVIVGLSFLFALPGLAIALGVAKASDKAGYQSMGTAYLWGGPPGARGTGILNRDDIYSDAGRAAHKAGVVQSFLGAMSGPELMEAPNYVLGNENRLRTALNEYSRLKQKGLVGSWQDYWNNYKLDHNDDLDVDLYTFGDESFVPGAYVPGASDTLSSKSQAAILQSRNR